MTHNNPTTTAFYTLIFKFRIEFKILLRTNGPCLELHRGTIAKSQMSLEVRTQIHNIQYSLSLNLSRIIFTNCVHHKIIKLSFSLSQRYWGEWIIHRILNHKMRVFVPNMVLVSHPHRCMKTQINGFMQIGHVIFNQK